MRIAYLAVLGATLCAAPLRAEDLTVVSKQSRGDNPPATTTSYFSSEKMRTSNEGSEAIVDLVTGSITMIDNTKKEYSIMTREEMEAMMVQLEAQMKQLDAQMANMPPAVREKMAAMTGGGATATVTVTKGTGGRTIAGYSCQNWIVTMGESMRQESCVTSDLTMPMAAYDGYKRFYSSMSSTPMGKMMMAMAEKFKEIKGFPLTTSTTMKVMGKSMTSTSEVTEIKKGAIPASAFAVPGGYKKVDSPASKMLANKKK